MSSIVVDAKPYLKNGVVGHYSSQRMAGLGTRMVLVEKEGTRQFQLNVYQDYIKEEDIDEVVNEWMSRYQPKKAYPVPAEIDELEFLNVPLDQSSCDKILERLDISNIILKKNWNDDAAIKEYQYKDSLGQGSYTELI